MRAMNVSLTPQVYVVDADGKIVYSQPDMRREVSWNY